MVDQPPATPDNAPYMACSECRAQMRDRYFALNERPICAKCRPKFAWRIERTDGAGAIWRVGLQGALVALIGVVSLVVVLKVWPAAAILLLVPIGHYIGKRMMKSLDGYSNRRYQYLAVGLTYLCFLIGFAVSAVGSEREARNRRTEIRAKMQGTMATQSDALREEMAALNAQMDDTPGPPGEDSRLEEPAAAEPGKAAAADTSPGSGNAVVLLLLSPVLAMMQFGITFAAIGLMALIYAMYQAWKQTDGQGMSLALSGPFRVGQGPIPAR